MNILFMYHKMFNPTTGGVERVTDLLCREFQMRGHNVTYLCCDPGVKNGIDEYAYPAPAQYFPCGREWHKPDVPENIKFFNDFVITQEIDIVIIQDCLQFKDILSHGNVPRHTKIITVLHNNPLCYLKNIYKVILSKCNNWQALKKLPRELKWAHDRRTKGFKEYAYAYNNAIMHSDAFCLLSMKLLPELQSIYKGDTSKITAIANPNTYKPLNDICLSQKKKQLLYVGRIDNLEKRVDCLIKLWKLIYLDFPDWELVIVGDGPHFSEIRNVAKSLDRVTLTGRQDPEPYYRDASILCLTSNSEGWAMVLTEAMAFGTVPILFNSFPVAADIVTDGVTGMLVKPFSIRQYEHKLRILMLNAKLRQQMALNAIEHIKQYDITNIADEWEKLFKHLLSAPEQ